MTRMVIDGLTAALLTPPLAREGWTLTDFAASLRTALSSTYEHIHLKQLKRDAMAAGFAIGAGREPTILLVPGADAFSAAGDSAPMRGVPAMWGSVLRIDDRLELRPDAIRCHRDVLAMPSRNTGRFLIAGHELPETLMIAVGETMAGQPLASLVTIEGVDLSGFPVKSIRPARIEDFDRVRVSEQMPLMSASGTPVPPGFVVAVNAGPITSVELV